LIAQPRGSNHLVTINWGMQVSVCPAIRVCIAQRILFKRLGNILRVMTRTYATCAMFVYAYMCVRLSVYIFSQMWCSRSARIHETWAHVLTKRTYVYSLIIGRIPSKLSGNILHLIRSCKSYLMHDKHRRVIRKM
jgi:hypothetical protein